MNTTTVREGEIISKETFGSTSKERYYVKPPDQSAVIVINITSLKTITNWFTKVFLPQGYPDSVSKDYLAYQVWDTAQAFCSTISGILATQEVLRGVGVGDQNATPLAATITWVLKDGCGHIGRILFAFTHGKYLDAYSKKWRMYADILNDAAMCIEIALPYFKVYSLFALCISTVMKAIVGVAGGATRVAMTQHHAILGNLADVSAKDSAQETAVNLIASMAALFIISYLGSSLTIFMLMMVLHIVFNYFAVRAVCLRTLNEPRFLLVIDKYLRQEIVATPCEINRIEPIIFYQLGPCILDLKISGFKINLGASMYDVFKGQIDADQLNQLKEIYRYRDYILVPKIEHRTMYVLIKQDSTADNVLCAYFHAVLLAIVTCAINDEPLVIYKNQDPRPFAQVCATLQCVEWSREEARIAHSRFTYNPSVDLLNYLNRVVVKEWPRIRDGLTKTGWDLSKHLLITDQWRFSRDEKTMNQISGGKTSVAISYKDDTEYRQYPFSDIIEELMITTPQIIPGTDSTIEPSTTNLLPSEKTIQPSSLDKSAIMQLDNVSALPSYKPAAHPLKICETLFKRTDNEKCIEQRKATLDQDSLPLESQT